MTNRKKLIIILIFSLASFSLFLSIYKNNSKTEPEDIRLLNSISVNNEAEKRNFDSRIVHVVTKDRNETEEVQIYFRKDTGQTKILFLIKGQEPYKRTLIYSFDTANYFLLTEQNSVGDTSSEINKYYFKDLNMLYWVDPSGKFIDRGSRAFAERENNILMQLEYLLEVVKE